MSNLRRVLERQQKEREEIQRRRAEEDRDADEEEEQMLAAAHDAVGVLGLIPEQKLTAALRMLAYGASAEQVDEIARMRKSTILECLNDLNVLGQSPVFDEVLRGHSPQVTYQINNTVYSGAYYLADGIYPRWTTFVKTISNPQSEKERNFASFQEGYRKDVERCFGILQAHWAIIRGAARMLDEEVLRSIMMTCIILHNMIVEDEYDYDAPESVLLDFTKHFLLSMSNLRRVLERQQKQREEIRRRRAEEDRDAGE
ncbi:uncharacterized protein LOC110751167 [Prunus avium]|uniref:Uncharacterized protein LOC110751167 n=1 Tax=Prunus avium TaxID=42229 RepID=A0A6P5RW19_PRUAV|nr:uncharacterized protein LOC110751167 [Prunus avium]